MTERDLSSMNESKGEGKCTMDRMGCSTCEARLTPTEGFPKNASWIADSDAPNVKDPIGVSTTAYDNSMANLEIPAITGAMKRWFLISDVVLANHQLTQISSPSCSQDVVTNIAEARGKDQILGKFVGIQQQHPWYSKLGASLRSFDNFIRLFALLLSGFIIQTKLCGLLRQRAKSLINYKTWMNVINCTCKHMIHICKHMRE